jgi:hypothetical protein
MARRFSLIGVPIAVAVVSLVVTAGPVLAAEPNPAPSVVAASPSAAPSAEHVRDLHELRTSRGYHFYTLSDSEAERAERVHRFTPTAEAEGLGLYLKKVEGSVPVHRLRLLGERPSYIVVTNGDELEKLRNDTDDPWEFHYEGVIGYLMPKQTPGTVAVNRFGKDHDWRLARASRADLPAAGYHDDGLLGFAPITD